MATALIAMALICIGVSLWIRRATWAYRWERWSTIAVAFLGAGIVFTTPAGPLRFVGHVCLIMGAAAIVIAAVTRIEGTTRRSVTRWVGWPLCIGLLTMVAALSIGALLLYWAAVTAALTYLLTYAVLALCVLRRDPQHRAIANLYIIPCVVGIIGFTGQWVVALIMPRTTEWWAIAAVSCNVLWASGFALGAAYSWRVKTEQIRRWKRATKFRSNQVDH